MSSDDFFDLLKERMAGWIALDPSTILLVEDTDVAYDPPRSITVIKERLFGPKEHSRLANFLEGSHSWVHANFLITTDGVQVISLRKAAAETRRTDRPVEFSLNVSKELTPLTIVAHGNSDDLIG